MLMPEYIKKWNLQWIIPLLALIVSIIGIPWKDTIETLFPTKLWYYIGHYVPEKGHLVTRTKEECPDCWTYPRFKYAEFHRCGEFYCVDEGTKLLALAPPEWSESSRVIGRTEPGASKGVKKHIVKAGECIKVVDTRTSPTAIPPEEIGGYFLWVRAHKTTCD